MYCYKCGKNYPDDQMRVKIGSHGRRIGSQCITCIKGRSESLLKRGAPSGEGAVCVQDRTSVKVPDQSTAD